jgi:hypothetical protein
VDSFLYDWARDDFLQGRLLWRASGGHVFRAMLVDLDLYIPDRNLHRYLSAVPISARAGAFGATGREDGVALTPLTPGQGVADAQDIIIPAVPVGGEYEALVIYRDDGISESSCELVCLIGRAVGLPAATDGGNIMVGWSDTANRIFRL